MGNALLQLMNTALLLLLLLIPRESMTAGGVELVLNCVLLQCKLLAGRPFTGRHFSLYIPKYYAADLQVRLQARWQTCKFCWSGFTKQSKRVHLMSCSCWSSQVGGQKVSSPRSHSHSRRGW